MPAFCLLKQIYVHYKFHTCNTFYLKNIYILGQDNVFIKLNHFSPKENGADWMEGVSRLHHAL